MLPVGPRNTEYASTNGTISATTTSSTSSSKKPEEPEREERDRGELRDVREHLQVAELRQHRDHREPGRERQQAARRRERQHDPVEQEDARHQHERQEGDVPPERDAAAAESAAKYHAAPAPSQAGERDRALPAQYGGSSAHQEPSVLNAFQNAVFAGASSSEVSMSGTTSASIVGVNRCSSPERRLDGLARAGTRGR